MARPIVAPHSGAKETVLAFAEDQGAKRMAEVRAYVEEVYRLGGAVGYDGFRTCVQTCLETNNFRSPQWEGRLNPGAIGVTDNWDQGLGWASGRDAARAMLVHLAAYLGTLPKELEPYKYLDPRYDVARKAYGGTVDSWDDLGNGKWATDPNYARNLATREKWMRQFEGSAPDPEPQEPAEIVLPFTIKQTIIPKGQTNQRPGIKQAPSNVVFHETANTRVGANALMHSNWLLGGAQGHPDRQVSVHFFVDDGDVVYQMLPLDEVSFNAGCGSCAGNYGGISIELCVNSDGDYEKARRNAAILAAWLLRKIGKGTESLANHNRWSGKWCPAIILNRNLWPDTVRIVESYLGGASPSPYGEPSPVVVDGREWDGLSDVTVNAAQFFADKRTVTFKLKAPIRKYALVDALEVAPKAEPGDTAEVLGWVVGEAHEGENRWWLLADWGRTWVGNTEEKPEVDAPDDTPPDTDPDVPGPSVVNGRRVYSLGPDGGRDVTAAVDAPIRAYTDPAAPTIRTLEEGETARALYWTFGSIVESEPVWWVLEDGNVLWSGATVERPM